jgi:hypothetical protein
LKQVVYHLVWAIGILVAADALGFEPETVVTGLGLTSLALGFALKDIISNFVSGILILGLRPFQIGDEIVVGETEGSVQRIRLRAAEIKTYDGRLVLVPNAELFIANVGYANRDSRDLLAMVAAIDPDVVLLTEPGAWWQAQLAPHARERPYRVLQPQEDNVGDAALLALPADPATGAIPGGGAYPVNHRTDSTAVRRSRAILWRASTASSTRRR